METYTKCPKLPWMIDFHSTAAGREKYPIFNSQLQAAFAPTSIEHSINLNTRSKVSKKRLTSIICTVDRNTHSAENFQCMMEAGMCAIRIKIGDLTHIECNDVIQTIREAIDKYSTKIGCVYSLPIGIEIKGSDIRIGTLKQNFPQEITLTKGNPVSLTVDPGYEELVTETMIYVDYPNMIELIAPEDRIYINNGKIRLSVTEIVGDEVKCFVETSGKLVSNCNIRFPDFPVDVPEISEQDLSDIMFAINEKIDIMFVPGMKTRESVKKLKAFLGSEGQHIMIISKIDSFQALLNVQGIVDESDGVVINRIALAIDLPEEKVFLAQKSIVGYCNKVGKPVICSSQILESLITSGAQPSSSEICDIANAVMDGIDGFLLSREISMGEDPVQAISKLSSICREAEAAVYQKQVFSELSDTAVVPLEPIYSLAISAVQVSQKCNAAAIVVLTTSGRSAKIITRFRPRCPVIAITRLGHVARQLHLYRGIDPLQYIKPTHFCWCRDADDRMQYGITWGKVNGFIRVGDAIVILAAARPGVGFTNFIQVIYASEFDTIPS
uniref:Pyruvate kinase n=1 Tax=Photinus pyralis TaxID=7054 RepID=A0A1Y1LFI1_PHOPY